ncbi:MAG: formylglycine-generating enzyme family protein [Treponema sp.]
MKKFILFLSFVLLISCKHRNNGSDMVNQVSVYFNSNSKMGKVIAKVDNKEIQSGAFIGVGKTISFKASFEDGYCVDYWKINEEDKYSGQQEIDIKLENNLNVSLYFKSTSNLCQLLYSFNENEGQLLVQKEANGKKESIKSGSFIERDSKLFFEAKPKDNFYLAGWKLNGKKVNGINSKYELDIKENASIAVVFSNIKYEDYFAFFNINSPITVPCKVDDSKRITITNSFAIAKYELTYDIWYETYKWAIENGYTFANVGIAGSKGGNLAKSKNSLNSNILSEFEFGDERLRQPVTRISWRDAIVWCNAYSEKLSLEPSYKYNGKVIKDATLKTDGVHFDVDFVNTEKVKSHGYRLPYTEEWEAAARFSLENKNVVVQNGQAVNAMINGKLVYFTKGDSASGAKKDYTDIEECKMLAWFDMNSSKVHDNGSQTNVVAVKNANDLGLFDMSGNVYEFVTARNENIDLNNCILRGGAYNFGNQDLQIGKYLSISLDSKNDFTGFRLAKNVGVIHDEKMQVEKVVINNMEYINNAASNWKDLVSLESGKEEILIKEDDFNIAIYTKTPKEFEVELMVDDVATEVLKGSSGVFEKKGISVSEKFKTIKIKLSKNGYVEKNYIFKVKNNSNAISIPKSLRIKKLFLSKGTTRPYHWIEPSSNGIDYNVEIDEDDTGVDFHLWILGEEKEAVFRIKTMNETINTKANGKERLLSGRFPFETKCRSFVILLMYNGQQFEYNLNICVTD